MATSSTASAVRRLATKLAPSSTITVSGTRQFHASGPKHYGDEYIHAEHMYDIQGMKNRKLKVFLGTFGALAIGIMVPIWAVQYQRKKQGGV
ncbi:hypothetical protein CY35_15G016100 [Sphagnum magellanicum]|nr:hypothetical protein CY35_15G016100 [Sphagnum magellanicum]